MNSPRLAIRRFIPRGTSGVDCRFERIGRKRECTLSRNSATTVLVCSTFYTFQAKGYTDYPFYNGGQSPIPAESTMVSPRSVRA
jgi:hypothetical protein